MKGAIDKIKLVNAGVKSDYGNEMPSSYSKDYIHYPNLHLSTKEAPMLAGSEVGNDVTLLIKTKVVSHSMNQNSKRKNEDFCLEVREIGVVSVNENEDKSERKSEDSSKDEEKD